MYELDDRLFLEVVRFDRKGKSGRCAMISLANIDAEFGGEGRDWTGTLRRLTQLKLTQQADLEAVRRAQLFGQWIGNTDMHLGNLSFQPRTTDFSLLPLYDMAPMRWAPVRGELPRDNTLTPPVRNGRDDEAWLDSGKLASEYWGRL